MNDTSNSMIEHTEGHRQAQKTIYELDGALTSQSKLVGLYAQLTHEALRGHIIEDLTKYNRLRSDIDQVLPQAEALDPSWTHNFKNSLREFVMLFDQLREKVSMNDSQNDIERQIEMLKPKFCDSANDGAVDPSPLEETPGGRRKVPPLNIANPPFLRPEDPSRQLLSMDSVRVSARDNFFDPRNYKVAASGAKLAQLHEELQEMVRSSEKASQFPPSKTELDVSQDQERNALSQLASRLKKVIEEQELEVGPAHILMEIYRGVKHDEKETENYAVLNRAILNRLFRVFGHDNLTFGSHFVASATRIINEMAQKFYLVAFDLTRALSLLVKEVNEESSKRKIRQLIRTFVESQHEEFCKVKGEYEELKNRDDLLLIQLDFIRERLEGVESRVLASSEQAETFARNIFETMAAS